MGRLCSRFFPKKAGWRTFCLPIAIGTGTKFCEHYACRACPAFANQKRGYKFDRSQKTITVQNFCCGHWRSVAVQTISKAVIYQGAGFQLRADARFAQRRVARLGVRVQQLLQICLEMQEQKQKP